MTIRRYLTSKERREMFAAQGHQCALCGADIFLEGCIAEHTHPVALGNDQKPDCLVCESCADRKTNGTRATTYGSDKHAIAKVKRLAQKAAGTWRPNRKRIRSRGFDKTRTKKFGGEVVPRKKKAPGPLGTEPGANVAFRGRTPDVGSETLPHEAASCKQSVPPVSASRQPNAEKEKSGPCVAASRDVGGA